MTKFITTSIFHILLISTVSIFCHALVFASETIPINNAEPVTPQKLEEQTAIIRKHHLKRLDDKLTNDLKVIDENCKYESDISTRPPENHVVLTFDDGPEPIQTEYILDILKRHHISATFFMIGEKVKQYPDLVAKVYAENHQVVANHSWSHPNFHDISTNQQFEQILKSETFFSNNSQPKLFRYPYGNSSCETNRLVHSRGYKIVGWHIDSCDWAFDKSGAIDFKEAVSCGVLPQYHNDYVAHVVSAVRARKGGIILMHEIHPNTIKKLEEIIIQILADGFIFGTILDDDFIPSMR